MNEIINPYTNIPYAVEPVKSNTRFGSDYFRDVNELQVGMGSSVFRVDEQGLWLGAERFADAPFRIDMQGNIYAASLDLTGYLQVGQALGDVQNSASTLSQIRSNLGSINAGSITGVTITGGTVRTSSGSTRVEMAESGDYANTLTIYYAGDARVILGGTDAFAITFLGVGEVGGGQIYSAGTNQLNVNTGGSDYEFNDSGLYSYGQDLGGSGNEWYNIYSNGTGHFSGKLKIPVGTNLY